LRRRFADALQWFNRLEHITCAYIDSILAVTRSTLDASDDLLNKDEDNEGSQSSQDDENSEVDENTDSTLSPPPLTRPSEYLRARCPLCFGGRTKLPQE
jgi:hypothetical protein